MDTLFLNQSFLILIPLSTHLFTYPAPSFSYTIYSFLISIFKKCFIYFYLCLWVLCLHLCVYIHAEPTRARRGHQELELTAENCHLGSPRRSAGDINHKPFSSPLFLYLITFSTPQSQYHMYINGVSLKFLLIFTCTNVHHVHVEATRGQKRHWIPGTTVIAFGKPPCVYWEPNVGPLQEQQTFLTTEHLPSPQISYVQ